MSVYLCIVAVMHYYDNPGGMIPTWLINWAAKVCVRNFFCQYLFYSVHVAWKLFPKPISKA